MGILSGLANFAQDAGPTAGAVAQAQAQGSAQRNQQALQMLMLARQQKAAEIENALNVSKTGEQNALARQHMIESDPSFAGQKAGAEAAATAPYKIQQMQMDLNNRLTELKQSGANEMQVAAARIAGEKSISDAQIAASASRQTNQQGFTATQNDLNRKATATNQGNAQQAHAANITQTQSGQVLPIVESWVNRGPLAHPAKAPATSSPVTPTTAPDPTTGLSDADLWEQQRDNGLTAEQATAFVKARHQ